MDYQAEAIQAIEAQQAKVKYHSHQWMVGEQLKDICRHEPRSAELLVQDLKVESMSITEAEKKISAFARKNSGCASAIEADRILRKFYGLPEIVSDPVPEPETTTPLPAAKPRRRIDPLDFL